MASELRQIADQLLGPDLQPRTGKTAAVRLLQLANALVTNKSPAAAAISAEARRSFASLSPWEREVFSALADGLTIRDIAVRLNRSPKTINNHRTHVMHKLQLRNVSELTRLAIRPGVTSL